MWRTDYQYYVALTTLDTGREWNAPLSVDWVPAAEWAAFEQGLYRESPGEHAFADTAAATMQVIEPVWSDEHGPPYVRGVSLRPSGADGDGKQLPLAVFSDAVTAASTALVARGELTAGQKFGYRVYALARGKDDIAASAGYSVVCEEKLPRIDAERLSPYLQRAQLQQAGPETAAAGSPEQTPGEPMPVFVPDALLRETADIGRTAREVETGGILVGKLCRDPGGQLFSVVTAQIPAEHTEATQTSLRFTPQTWVSVDAALALRDRGEIALGWWHSHPFFCRNCPPARRRRCAFSVPAFSAADCSLHREVFQKPWNIALLLSFLGEHDPSYDVFTWQQGRIGASAFFSLQTPKEMQVHV